MIKITSDMTSRSYFGKMNSTLGSVVPLAMFIFIKSKVQIQSFPSCLHDVVLQIDGLVMFGGLNRKRKAKVEVLC